MPLDQYAAIAEIVGVILVIASLIYVARQLRQNTEMLIAESRNSIIQQHMQELFSLVENPDIWRGISGQDLDDESVRLNNWLTAFSRAREHEWFQFKHRALDEASWASYSRAIPIVLSSDRAKAWWEAFRPGFDNEFAERVDELLQDETLNALYATTADAVREN